MVTLLMMPITLVNQAVVTLGLKAMRTARLTGGAACRACVTTKSAISVVDDLLRIARADAGLHHRRRVDATCSAGLRPAAHVALEMRRDVDDEGVPPGVHQPVDVALGDRLRRLEIGRQECVRDAARQLGMVLVDDGDRRIVQLLRVALRLRDDGERKRSRRPARAAPSR